MANELKQGFVTTLARSHGRQLRRFLAVRLRNASADVPDLMQEVFLRLLRISNHETIRNPQAYLYTIASHVLQQHALKQAHHPSAEAPVEIELEETAAADTDPAAEAELELTFEAIEHSLRAISPRAYTTLILSRCHGMPLHEIAAQFGVSRAQVKKYLAKALIHVREHLSDVEKEVP